MARKRIDIQPPLAGLDRAFAVQSQPPFTLSDALNVRGRSPFDDRAILASRPGLVKAFCQLLGAGSTESFTVEFGEGLTGSLEDAFLRDTSPTTNFGGPSSQNLKIGVGVNTDNTVDRSILHFDLSAIPTGAVSTVIVSASLAMTALNPEASTGAAKVRRITETTWVEHQATWNNKATATAWTTPNVKGTSSPATQTGPFTTTGEVDWTFPLSSGRFSITGLGPLVQDAFTNRSKQLHIMLMAADETVNNRNITCRDIEYTLFADHPVLTVTYEVTS